MKNYMIMALFPLFFSCKKEKAVTPENLVHKIDSSTAQKTEYELDKNSIFGVYQLTDRDIAICVPVQFGNKELPLSEKFEDFLVKDSVPWIYNRDMKDYTYYDTLSVDRLIYNKGFEDAFKTEMKDAYFVYGTKAAQKCTVKRIVFKSDECGNDYIAYILNVSKNLVGNPLIASEKEIPLKYGRNYSRESLSIKKAASKESTENNYGHGKYNPVVFANYGNLYFTYYDDFKWHKKNSGSEVQFPERAVFQTDSKGKTSLLWSAEMDLLGLPCL